MAASHIKFNINRSLLSTASATWKLWTEPRYVSEWWGPHHFTIPLCELDVTVGGKLLIHMKAPDGTIYPMGGVYKELIVGERIVFVGEALDKNGNALFEQLTTILFEKSGAQTNLQVMISYSNVKPEGAPYLAGAEIGWNQMLDKLEQYIVTNKLHD